jgi:hypothetical protein
VVPFRSEGQEKPGGILDLSSASLSRDEFMIPVVPFLCEGEENQEESWTSVLLLFQEKNL